MFKVETVKQTAQHSRIAKTATTPRWKPEISPTEIISLNGINGFESVMLSIYLTTLLLTKIIQRQ